MNIVAFVGFKGAGKSTAAQVLEENGFIALSFADAIKDALASIFCWPRRMLQGDTPESRIWREQTDQWWANKLGIVDFSPRRAMQLVGTEAMRMHFHPDIWILNVERRIMMLPAGASVVLVDGRFPNELSMARRLGGSITRIKQGAEPFWYETALAANTGSVTTRTVAMRQMKECGIHESEWAWVGSLLDHAITNDGTIPELHATVRRVFL